MQIPPYEHPVWQSQQGMRPGGLDITAQALSLCGLQPGARILDVGCGAGATLRFLTTPRTGTGTTPQYGLAGFGVDISTALLRRAQDGSLAGFTQANAEQLPFANDSLDAVISECALSIFDADAALRECHRVLKPGGCLMVSDLYARDETGLPALRSLPAGTSFGSVMPRAAIESKLAGVGLQLSIWQDCSEKLKDFPVCSLSTAAQVDVFDLIIVAGTAKLGYYWLVARKGSTWTSLNN